MSSPSARGPAVRRRDPRVEHLAARGTGSYGVDPDARLAVAAGGAAGEVVHSRLGGAVVRQVRIATEAADRRRVHDRSTTAELDQCGDLVLQAQGDAAATSARIAFFRPFAHAERHGALPIDAERASLLAWTIAHGAVDLDLSGHLRKDGSRTTPRQLVPDLVALLTAEPSTP
jgi:hypothetical protein